MVSVSIILRTSYLSISSESTALALVAFGGLRLLIHINLTHLGVHIVLQRWNEARLFLASDSHQFVLLLGSVEEASDWWYVFIVHTHWGEDLLVVLAEFILL